MRGNRISTIIFKLIHTVQDACRPMPLPKLDCIFHDVIDRHTRSQLVMMHDPVVSAMVRVLRHAIDLHNKELPKEKKHHDRQNQHTVLV
jgi:hypothetical protein